MTLLQQNERYESFLPLFQSISDEGWMLFVKDATDKQLSFETLLFSLKLLGSTSIIILNHEDLTMLVREIIALIGDKEGIFNRSELSASKIANLRPDVFSSFSQMIFPGSYTPNQRLREITDLPLDSNKVREAENILFRSHLYPLTFMHDKKTEKSIGNMVFNRIMVEISKLYDASVLKINETVSPNYICTGTISEPVVTFHFHGTNFIVISSEIKGFEASVARCFSQAFTVAADSALHLLNLGLDISDCVIPGICSSGDSFAFIAVYLIEDRWPIMVNLSGSLSISGTHLTEVAKWFIRVFEFGILTSQTFVTMKTEGKLLEKRFDNFKLGELFLKPMKHETVEIAGRINGGTLELDEFGSSPTETRQSKGDAAAEASELRLPTTRSRQKRKAESQGKVQIQEKKAKIDATSGKIIEQSLSINREDTTNIWDNGPFKLNVILQIYQKLYENRDEDSAAILFPVGVSNLPYKGTQDEVYSKMLKIIREYFPDEVIEREWGNFNVNRPYPLIIFERLGNDWTTNKPEKKFHKSYLMKLRSAVDWLNRSKISHNDLLPRNVMWRPRKAGNGKEVPGVVEIKIIDFEYACYFGSSLPGSFSTAAARDYRYPFRFLKEIRGSQEANEFFYRAIARFLKSSFNSFRSFMTEETSEDLFDKVKSK